MARDLRLLAGAGALGVILAAGAPARADLANDAERLARMWSLAGARARRLPPIFVEHGRIQLVAVAEAAVAEAGAPRPAAPEAQGGRCLTAAFLAPRTIDFELETEITADRQDALEQLIRQIHPSAVGGEAGRIRSVAGAATITRCGDARAGIRQVRIHVASPRAAFEVVITESADPPGPLDDILPERAFGPLAPYGDPGRPVEPGPLADRVARAERRARVDGAARVARVEARASAEGTGVLAMRLPEGCHRLDLMAEVPAAVPRRATDVDAEAREVEGGRQLDRDRADAPDARLEVCLGELTPVEVPFVGASGPARVVLSDAYWPMPRVVPAQYGARARAGFAAALRRRNAPTPRDLPFVEAMGVLGDTLVPVAVEPGRCYFAAVALVRGDARSLRLVAEVGDRALRDDATGRAEGAGVAFCAETDETAVVRVAARGTSPWWALAVWPMD